MDQYKQNTTTLDQGHDMYDSGNRSTAQPLTFGYPKIDTIDRDFRLACRWQPNIDISRHNITVNSSYIRLTCAAQGSGAYTSGVHVHDGSAPNLSTTNLAFGYTDIGNSQNWSISTNWVVGTEYTSPDMKLAVKDWFDRGGYSSSDYIGLIVDGGDSASDEYKDCYNANYSTASYRPELEINYDLIFKDDINAVPNANIDEINGISLEDIYSVSS